MATVVPPPAKRQRREEAERAAVQQDVTAIAPSEQGTFRVRFVDDDNTQLADIIEIPLAIAAEKDLSKLLNTLLGRVGGILSTATPTLRTCNPSYLLFFTYIFV